MQALRLGRAYGPAAFRSKQLHVRLYASKRLIPDPNKVPRSEPIDLRDESFRKTNTIEDFSIYEVSVPPNNINSVLEDGFALASGARVRSTSEEPRGLLLVGHEAFAVDLTNAVEGLDKGRVELDAEKVLGIFRVVHPTPELLIVGLGGRSRLLGPNTEKWIRAQGMQIQVASTQHSASSFDLLSSERGRTVAGLLLPPNM